MTRQSNLTWHLGNENGKILYFPTQYFGLMIYQREFNADPSYPSPTLTHIAFSVEDFYFQNQRSPNYLLHSSIGMAIICLYQKKLQRLQSVAAPPEFTIGKVVSDTAWQQALCLSGTVYWMYSFGGFRCFKGHLHGHTHCIKLLLFTSLIFNSP